MTSRPATTLALAACWLVASCLAACVDTHPMQNDLFSFEVELSELTPVQVTGSPEDSLPYVPGVSCAGAGTCLPGLTCVPDGSGSSVCASAFTFDVQAIGRDGQPFPYRGPLRVRATPGVIVGGSDVVFMDGGRLEGVQVHIVRGLGATHIWFEADGFAPRPTGADYGQCNDGIDNDRNGRVDLADPGCQDATDDLEAPVSFATGVSPNLWFDNPRIRDIQFGDEIRTSPLVGKQVQVSAGNLVVSNVVANGFYVVDLDDNTEDRLYNAIFVFTFSKPVGVFFGDKLCGFSGAMDEFVGQAQLTFPSFEVYRPGNPLCDGFPGLDPDAQVPLPWSVTPVLLAEDQKSPDYLEAVYANSLFLERFESNLVSFTDVQVSTRFIACDKNDNGNIDLGAERDCRNDCQDEPLCSDLESYFQFAQYAGVTGDKKKIYGSIALADEFKPLDIRYVGGPDEQGRCTLQTTDQGFLEYTCPPTLISQLTGSLRHIYLCGEDSDETQCDLQFWVIDPRFDGDVVLAVTP